MVHPIPPPGRPEAPYGYTLAGAPSKYPRRDAMTGKRPGPTKARNSPIAVAVAVAVTEMRVALMRAGGLSVYRIALALKVRRQSVDRILTRPHVVAMVEDFRERLRADQLLRDWASKAFDGSSLGVLPLSKQQNWRLVTRRARGRRVAPCRLTRTARSCPHPLRLPRAAQNPNVQA
jgi:hypothetical protein